MAESTSLVFKDFVGTQETFSLIIMWQVCTMQSMQKSIKERWWVNQRIACPSQVDP